MDSTVTLWVATNNPDAPHGSTIFLRTPWRRLYTLTAPYCAWAKDRLGVEDYRSLGVLVTDDPDTALPKIDAQLRPARPDAYRRFIRLVPMRHHAKGLVPVASGRLRHDDT